MLSSSRALAQTTSGRFTGIVTDEQGGVIAGATVRVVNQQTFAQRETKTNAEGVYTIPSLPPGQYQVTVDADSFSRRSSDVVMLVAGQTFLFNAKMPAGGVQSNVDVTALAAVVETDTASISTTLSEKEVTGYGLNGRNFSQLITMAPGVSSQTGQDEAKVGVAGSAKFSVNGGRVEYNTFEVDGSDVLNTSINASRGQGEPLMVYPSIDAIQDMKVLTADYSALYGKSASGSVLVSTKSGTEKFHGNVYGFLRNEMFNARNYFDQPDLEPLGYGGKLHYRTPLYRRIDAGATFGGPLYIPHLYNTHMDKTFFFFSEEVRREKTPTAYNQAVPTLAERGLGTSNPGLGDFSDVCPPYTPTSTGFVIPSQYPDCPLSRVQNSSGDISIGSPVTISAAARAILDTGIIPMPNSIGGCNTTNPTTQYRCYVASVSPPTHWREELFRIDHDLTAGERLSFRYVHDSWDTVTLAPQWGVVQNSFPTIENQLNGPGLNMVLSLAQVLPRGFLNRISFSYAVEHISLLPQPGVGVTSLVQPAAVGSAVGHIFANGFGGDKLPGVVFQGSNGAYGGHGFASDTGYAPWSQANPTFNLRDDAGKMIGKHNVQWGFEGTYVQQNEFSAVSGANSGDLQGLLVYSNQQSIFTYGNAFADFLPAASAIKSYTQDSAQFKYYSRYKTADGYLQDDWKATPRLTINAGLRMSFFGSWINPKGKAFNWRPEAYNPSLAGLIYVDPLLGFLVNSQDGTPVPLDPMHYPALTNGLVHCGTNGVPSSCMTNRIFHPAPRVGASWDPWGDGKTAVRGGYGLFWEHGTGYEANIGSLIGSAPMVLSETQSNIASLNEVGFTCQTACGAAAAPPGGVTFPLNVTSIPTKAVYSYVQQWSLGFERQVGKRLVTQITYVGTKGTHLSAVRDLNQLQPLSNSQNPFAPGQPITSSVCNSGANGPYFTVGGQNAGGTNAGITIPSSPAIGKGSPGYRNMFVACTGNPGFAGGLAGGTGKLGVSADTLRPYTGFSNIIAVDNIADSSYHAFQATIRETTGPLTLGLAYTYSHSIDDSSDRSSANFANSLDLRSNRASSDFDERQMLNVNYIYDLPLVKLLENFTHILGNGGDAADEAAWTAGPVVKTWLGGWQLSGITAFQTGTPFSVINGGGSDGTGAADNAGVGDGLGVGSYADVIGSVKASKPSVTPSAANVGPLLLNPNAFAAPRGLTFGDTGRNYLNNPSRTNFNMSLFKHFKPFKARLDIEFRAEVFNVFNHTQFRITDPSHPGNTGNNVINCYGGQTALYSAGSSNCLSGNSFLHPVDAHDPRIMQFGLKGSF